MTSMDYYKDIKTLRVSLVNHVTIINKLNVPCFKSLPWLKENRG